MRLFCLKCRKFTKSKNTKRVVIYIKGNKRLQLKALCCLCNCKKCKFLANDSNDE